MQGAEIAEAGGQTAEPTLAVAHQTLLRTSGMQFQFAGAPIEQPPAWLDPLLKLLVALGPLLKFVFWGGLIVGAGLILYFLLREFVPERWFRRSIKVAPTDWQPAPETARALLDDADGLAAAGRFEEAIHLLLFRSIGDPDHPEAFRSIDDLAGRRPGAVRPALTSRDIAELDVLPAEARVAFARLAQAVERSFFGGQPAGAEAFGTARRDYEAFAFSEGWR